jgi:hypothetical protein
MIEKNRPNLIMTGRFHLQPVTLTIGQHKFTLFFVNFFQDDTIGRGAHLVEYLEDGPMTTHRKEW